MVPTLAEQARRLNPRPGRRPGGSPAVVLLTDPRLPDALAAAAALPAGSAVVLRHYDDPGRAELGRRLSALCRARRLLFLVAGDVRLAAALRADGLHLPEGLARTSARQLAWLRARGGWLSVAAHSAPALRRARRLGADWALLSPVFATASHPGAPSLGPRRFAALARGAGLPVLALGGVTAANAGRLRGAAGVAAVSGLAQRRGLARAVGSACKGSSGQ